MIRLGLTAGALSSVIALAFVAVCSSRLLAAGGTLDQTLAGNPDCSPSAFEGRASSKSALEQEFVPSYNSLTGIDICIIPPPDHEISFQILEGTIAQPGGDRYEGGLAAYPDDHGWVHIDVPNLIVHVDRPMIIEASTALEDWTWVSTCGRVADGCTHVDGDLYPAGKSSVPGADLLFRSYGSNDVPGPTPTPTPGPTTPEKTVWPTPTVAPLPSLRPNTRYRADLNCDGEVNGLDLLMLIKEYALLNPLQCGGELGVAPFDLDCNSVIGPGDILELAYFTAGIGYPFPTPAWCPALNTLVSTIGGK